jgi:hypothetical protein
MTYIVEYFDDMDMATEFLNLCKIPKENIIRLRWYQKSIIHKVVVELVVWRDDSK